MSDQHAPVDYKGRTVCTCGDFNCASLDATRRLQWRDVKPPARVNPWPDRGEVSS